MSQGDERARKESIEKEIFIEEIRKTYFFRISFLNNNIHVVICEEKFINRTDHPAKGQRPNTKILETLPEKRKSNENFA